MARSRSSQALAPAAKPRTKEVDVRLGLLVVETARGVALVRRPQTARFLKGAWGFPTYRADPSRQDEPMVGDGHAGTLEGHFVLGVPTVKHSITHHRITAEVRRGEREDLLQHFDEVIWCNKKEVDQHLVSNLDRKAWRLLRSAN